MQVAEIREIVKEQRRIKVYPSGIKI